MKTLNNMTKAELIAEVERCEFLANQNKLLEERVWLLELEVEYYTGLYRTEKAVKDAFFEWQNILSQDYFNMIALMRDKTKRKLHLNENIVREFNGIFDKEKNIDE